MIIQHLGGVASYLGKKPNPIHRKFGRILATIGRLIAGGGWLLAGNERNAIIVGVATVVILILSVIIAPKPAIRI